jgi:hypothetical protein
MRERRLRIVRVLARASDRELLVSLAQRDEAALDELSYRHSNALSVLACAIVRDPASAKRAVADVYASVWDEPEQFDRHTSVRAQLAALVLERCRTMGPEPSNQAGGLPRLQWATRDATFAMPERIAVALIAFGDHTCQQAADLVGSCPAAVTERLRGFVLDPDHFDAFYATADNAFARHDPRFHR